MKREIIIGVYKITNKQTNEAYVGSSKNIYKRWAQHKMPSTWKYQPNSKLYLAMQELGLENFNFEVIEECEIDVLKQREEYWMKQLNPAYNTNASFRTPEERAAIHLAYGLKYAEEHKNDEKEKARRNRNSQIWKEKNREKAREAVRKSQLKAKERAAKNSQ